MNTEFAQPGSISPPHTLHSTISSEQQLNACLFQYERIFSSPLFTTTGILPYCLLTNQVLTSHTLPLSDLHEGHWTTSSYNPLEMLTAILRSCDHASWQILIIKPTRCTNFSNLFWNETCRVSFQNRFEKLVYLVGFITRVRLAAMFA
jgi:hypothetical protein